MSKGKLKKFAEMSAFGNVYQYPASIAGHGAAPFSESDNAWRCPLAGRWASDVFRNDNPITLELGCGRGEYTVALARMCPKENFIGVDIKGARMYTGAKEALQENLRNAAFLRTNIEIIHRFFSPGEVSVLWLTFSDPQQKNARKRLTSSFFLQRYRRFLADGGVIHLKTDSNFLFTYTSYIIEKNGLPLIAKSGDIYSVEEKLPPETTAITTYYERQWLERGIKIKYLAFRLPQKGPLVEPGIDIPLDLYRSFRREKRGDLQSRK